MKNKHAFIMIICCIAPLVGFVIAYSLGVSLGTLGTIFLILLCPLGHLIMMRGTGKKHTEHEHYKQTDTVPKT